MDLVSAAMHFAIDAHNGEKRKGDGRLAVLHELEAAAIVASITQDEATIAAAALHDTVEDAGVTIEEIEEKFGKRVAQLVASETENKRRDLPAADTWRIRKEEAVSLLQKTDDISVKMIFLGDKLSNMRSFYILKQREGDSMWNSFNQKDPEAHHWYYRSIADAMPELSDSLVWKELDRLIASVFNEETTE